MENIKLTEQQLKTLKLFSYYIQSHGTNEARCDFYISSECDIDFGWGLNWFGENRVQIEGYDTIDELIKYIISYIDPCMEFESTEHSGNLTFEIDCKDKFIEARASENVIGSNELGTSRDIDEESPQDLIEFYKTMKENNIKNGTVTFDGGGDSGWVDDSLNTDSGSMKVPSGVLDELYSMLENFYGGWEINEGSHGDFYFDFEENILDLNFNEHTESTEDRGKIFHIDF